MNSFVGTLQTLVTKTMEDTLMTIKAYEKARYYLLFLIHIIKIINLELNMMHIDVIMKTY
jgi:hypothetical protein